MSESKHQYHKTLKSNHQTPSNGFLTEEHWRPVTWLSRQQRLPLQPDSPRVIAEIHTAGRKQTATRLSMTLTRVLWHVPAPTHHRISTCDRKDTLGQTWCLRPPHSALRQEDYHEFKVCLGCRVPGQYELHCETLIRQVYQTKQERCQGIQITDGTVEGPCPAGPLHLPEP